MDNDVYALVYCRLGNNLFQIANGLTYAKRFGKKLHIVVKDSDYDPLERYPEFFSRFELERPNNQLLSNCLRIKEKDSQEPIYFDEPSGSVVLDGFFQSERYIDVDYVRRLFRIEDDTRRRLVGKYEGIEEGVGISIRRGDYLNYKWLFNILSAKYYNDMYNERFSGLKCFISSEDVNWCRNNIKIDDVQYIDERDGMALRALSLCKHHILSCSTFSWWAAWLEEQEDSVNVIPSKWFAEGSGVMDGEKIPDRWTKVELKDGYKE